MENGAKTLFPDQDVESMRRNQLQANSHWDFLRTDLRLAEPGLDFALHFSPGDFYNNFSYSQLWYVHAALRVQC